MALESFERCTKGRKQPVQEVFARTVGNDMAKSIKLQWYWVNNSGHMMTGVRVGGHEEQIRRVKELRLIRTQKTAVTAAGYFGVSSTPGSQHQPGNAARRSYHH